MSEPFIIKMPQLSDTMTEGVLVSWEKNIGDKIKRGDIVATVETDKAIMDVEVFREGYLSGPVVRIDTVVPVGESIAFLVTESDQVQAADGISNKIPAQSTSPAKQEQSSQKLSQNSDSGKPQGIVHVIKMPQLSDTMTEGVVVSWEKSIGDKISRGDVVAQVETDKAIMDVEVFREGYLSGPLATIDSVIGVGNAMAYLVEEHTQVLSSTLQVQTHIVTDNVTSPSEQEPRHIVALSHPAPGHKPPELQDQGIRVIAPRPDNRLATPYARKLAGQLHVNLNTVKSKSVNGIISAQDVLRAQPIQRPSEIESQIPAHSMPEIQVPGHGRSMTAMERAISHSMTAALTMPTFHVTVMVNHEKLLKAAKQNGVSITVAIAKACALAIKKHPPMNWAYQPVDKIVERDNVDIGMAVAAQGGGLVVPVLRHCESNSLQILSENWKDLVERARQRRLLPQEYANPTFLISNMGMMGVHHFTAIPTPGTCAILAIASGQKGGLPLTITADHRVVNGAEVATFFNTLKQIMEQPESWLGSIGPVLPEGSWDYDVVVIGGGPGGEDCARDLAAHGIKVAMINDAPFPGGECLWRGCIPSKAWRAAADRIRDRDNDTHLGVEGTTQWELNWEKLDITRRAILEKRGDMALKTDKGVKIKVIHGFASFESKHRVFVDTSGNSNNPYQRSETGDATRGEHFTFGCAVIATGAPPFVPPIPGIVDAIKNGGVVTSDTIWELKSQPKRLGVIGGGAIGVEMAQIFQDFGTSVTLLEGQERILAEVEPELAKHLTQILNADPNLTLITSAKVQNIQGQPGNMEITYHDSEKSEHVIACDYVLLATGKRPKLEPLRLHLAGVETVNGVIQVDSRSRTSTPTVFAVGDVIGGLMLAHTAGQQGRVAAATILGEDLEYDQDKDCGVIFTRPQAAFVGLTLDQAKNLGRDAVEVKVPLSIDAKAMINNELHGMIKMVAEKKSGRIIGVHLLADHADTLVGEGVMMVSGEMTVAQVANAIHPHPTQTEMFGDMARRLLSRLRRSSRNKKSEV